MYVHSNIAPQTLVVLHHVTTLKEIPSFKILGLLYAGMHKG